jgi:rhamnogalacturonyl hydrolase YesR
MMWLPVVTLYAMALATTAHPHASHHEPPKYSITMAVSIISRHQGILASTSDRSNLLQAGFVQKVFRQVTEQYPNHTSTPSLESYIRSSVDSVIRTISNATLDTTFPLDRLSSGNGLIYRYQETGNQSYMDAYEALYSSISLQPHNADGSLWYYVYPNYTYLDGMYSLAPFLTLYSTTTNLSTQASSAIIDDMILQLDTLWNHTHQNSSGLLVHGFDASHLASWSNPTTGASPHVWDRSLGWYCMALIDTLTLLPSSAIEVHTWLLHRLRLLIKSVVDAVDQESGAWWQVMDQPGREGNYVESSGSAMFVYAVLRGVREGYLVDNRGGGNGKGCEYEGVAKRAYGYLVDTFVVDNGNGTLGWNGTVGVCSLNSSATYEVCCLLVLACGWANANYFIAVLCNSAARVQ